MALLIAVAAVIRAGNYTTSWDVTFTVSQLLQGWSRTMTMSVVGPIEREA
jgi:hypothetical protein